MHRNVLTAILSMLAAAPVAAQESWETFQNQLTDRQGAFMCSEFDTQTGMFFCLELACEADGALTMELSRDGGAMNDTLDAVFAVNGVTVGTFSFQQSAPVGYARYASEVAAADETLRYWLSAGRSAQIVIGTEVQELSLTGSSAALSHVFDVCQA